MNSRRGWHLTALAAFALAAAANAHAWFTADRMPPGDFPGYAAQVQYVLDALLAYGRVPAWCAECYGGTTNFTASWKEILAAPLALVFEPVLATKLLFVLLRVAAAFGLYALVARELAAPAVGIAAGYAYSWGAIANHEIEHLDVAVACALLPLIWIAALRVLREGSLHWAVVLGAAMACQLANNWVHAATAPLAVVMIAAFAPWAGHALDRRWLGRGLAAFAVFCAIAASPVVWLASDTPNHRLFPPDVADVHRSIFVERSPFLFANREDVLAPWLAEHHPGYGIAIADGGKRYLGGVALAVIAAGAFALRREHALRRWGVLAGLAFLVQYWLALGPRTLLWQVGGSLHWSADAQAIAAWALRTAAILCALAGVGLRRRWPAAVGLALIFPTVSLWSWCASVLPPFAQQRSPGHFFDTAPFAFALVFALCLVSLARRVPKPQAAYALVAVVGAALALDYAPSARRFSAGEPLAQLSSAVELVSGLPGEEATRRIGLGPEYSPLQSWLLEQSSAGHAWGWLHWQAGPHWWDSYVAAVFRGARSERYAPLLRAARVDYLLLSDRARAPGEPWQRARGDGRFTLWQRGDAAPVAQLYRAWRVWDGAGVEADAAVDALRASAVLVAPPIDSSTSSSEPTPIAAQRTGPDRWRLELDAGDEPGLAFLSEGYHPWWQAEIDGARAPVLRASLAHLAVPVAPGRHTIELRLVRPVHVAAADAITATAWVAVIAAAAISIFRRARR